MKRTGPKPCQAWRRWAILALALIPFAGVERAFGAEVESAATHKQVAQIHPASKSSQQKLVCFCLSSEGRIVALVASGAGANPAELAEAPAAVLEPGKERTKAKCEVKILDGEGNLLESWPVDFTAQSLNVGRDGRDTTSKASSSRGPKRLTQLQRATTRRPWRRRLARF
jgi:hypothetical protein